MSENEINRLDPFVDAVGNMIRRRHHLGMVDKIQYAVFVAECRQL